MLDRRAVLGAALPSCLLPRALRPRQVLAATSPIGAENSDAPAGAARGPTRLAVWGLRHDHLRWVLPQILELKEAQLVGVGGERADLLESMKKKVPDGTPLYSNLQQMLDAVAPRALVALVPTAEQLGILRHCSRRKIHFYTHKPMASTLVDARAMDALATRAGIVAMVHCYPVLDPENQLFFDRILKGDVGEIGQLIVMSGIPAPSTMKGLSDDYRALLYEDTSQGAGVISGAAYYGLTYAAWLCGRPTAVMATINRHAPEKNKSLNDDCWIVLDYPRANVAIHGSWSMPFRHIGELIATGSKGQLRVWNKEVWFRPEGHPAGPGAHEAGVAQPPPVPPPALRNGVVHFLDCVRNGSAVHPALTTKINVLVQELAEAAMVSSKRGRKVVLP
jgi:predicted dehydrogenase